MARTYSGKQTGAFGGSLVFAEWEPDPETVEQALFNVADYTDNIERPLLAARAIAVADMEQHFITQTDPSGEEWQELDEDYHYWKMSQGAPDEILQLSGRLKRAATKPSAWIIVGEDLFFNAEVLPKDKKGRNYGLAHQSGSQGGGASSVPNDEDMFLSMRGKNLPARPFIGLSDEAEIQILEVFDLWYDETEAIYISSRSGVVQSREGGQFGEKLYPSFEEE